MLKKEIKKRANTIVKEQELKDEQNLLLNLIVELKKIERAKEIKINKNLKYLNRISNKILISDKKKLQQISLLLDNLLENGFVTINKCLE